MTSTINVNDNLVQFNNLLTALNYLLEEVQVRKEEVVKTTDIEGKVIDRMNSRDFKDQIISYIRNEYGEGLYQEVAFMVMEKIDNDIEAFLNARVDERLRELGVISAASRG